jgi:TRAP-type C4-dicarboxylate transport system substrate-binding protein
MTCLGVVICTVFLFGTEPVSGAAEAEWKFFTYFPSNDRVVHAYREMIEDINKSSAGALKISLYSAGELPYKATDGVKITATDKVQMADAAVGFVAGDVPAFNVYGMPFLCTTFEEFFSSVKSIEPQMNDELKNKFKIAVLFHWTMPPQNIWTIKPINTLEDLKGRKIRAWNPEQVTMLKQLGAIPVSISSGEVPTSLQRGVIDGAITSALSVNDWKLYDFVKFGLMINFAMGHQFVLVNMEEIAKLPKEAQEMIKRKGEEWEKKFRALTPQFEDEARKSLVSKGMTLGELTPADVKKAKELMRPMWEEWATKNGDVAKKLLNTVMQTTTK